MSKQYGTIYFEINRNLHAKCWSERTRYGFRHQAELIYKYENIGYSKACYYNRTWERFTYESVLRDLYNNAKKAKSLSPRYLRLLNKMIENGGEKEAKKVKSEFKTVAMVAKLGGIFGKTQKESNDWKARMIKAGLEHKGLIMPDDWESLSENEKQRRLDGVIAQLTA